MRDFAAHVDQTARTLIARRHIPRTTYRVQFNANFTFKDAEALVPYLHELGISDLYASPILKAFPGSLHGYDICDHSQLNPELGTRADFDQLVEALHAHDMHLIVDVVPNHMGIAESCNAWWNDVLENGPSSPYARYFDIDWQPVKPELADKVLIPILGDQYGRVLEDGQIKLVYREGAFSLHYGAHDLPLAPGTYAQILESCVSALESRLDTGSETLMELQSILTAVGYLPSRTETDPVKVDERRREKEVIKRRIAALYTGSSEAQTAIDAAISRINGTIGDPASFDLLDSLIEAQPYRMAYWRVAAEEINYRRFFDINTMAALRVELPEVFDDTHRLIFELIAEGKISGLRVDHPDGLWNPPEYFRRLQERILVDAVMREAGEDATREAVELAVSTWWDQRGAAQDERQHPLYVVVEKILSETEPLPRDWAVYGTTGYDFMNLVNGVLVDRDAEREMTALYQRFTGVQTAFAEMEPDAKRLTMDNSLSSEINSLAHQLERLTETYRHTRDFTLNGLRLALREVMAALSIYRTYSSEADTVTERDVRYVEEAIRTAKRRNPNISASVFDFVRDTLLLRNLDRFPEADQLRRFVMRFQQITSPVMAKSIEDTLFYVYNRLVSLNEVGGSPANFGISVDDFHAQNMRRCREWGYSMLATSTHDTKRGGDVRARINVLSEIPREWGDAVEGWRSLNAGYKLDGMPDANDEYLIYQTLIGACDVQEDLNTIRDRITGYMAKATKEAKVHTSWTNPDPDYDAAVSSFITAILAEGSPFLEQFRPFQRRIAYFGRWNSLSQELLKLTSPGVPDTYRGTEGWDFSLVDPDNRRPVDYARYRSLLESLHGAINYSELVAVADDDRLKLAVVKTALNFRRDHPEYFVESDYVPLVTFGAKARHVVAFERVHDGNSVLVIAPRLPLTLTGGLEVPPLGDVWGDTGVLLASERAYRSVFTGETLKAGQVALADALRYVPVGLFEAM
ncbi:MAG: malto-oligosyltrehalose synthase [Anaerolinea sp.]|nr:malto-oligosyltrehalose synthase [Anaerolinea sp.]